MARLKSAYREKEIAPPPQGLNETGRPSGQSFEAEPVGVEPSIGELEAYPEDAAIAEAVQADESRHALKSQIENLRRSEQLQRQAQMRQPSREQLLELWKQQGMTEPEADFLRANPELIDNPQLTALSAHEAAQMGHERGTESHMQATKQLFHNRLRDHAMVNAQTPAFFAPPASPEPTGRQRSAIVSAPVSREAPGTTGGYSEPSPSRIHLTAAEVEIARASGISEKQYALNKLRMLRERSNGERQ